mgnify:CR=1 FL=1
MENNLRHQIPGMPPTNKSKVKRVFLTALIIPALVLSYIVSYYYFLPSIFPKTFRGEVQNIRAFPTAEGKYKLWIQTDGTFRTTSRSNNMGQISLKTVGWFCRTYSYVYDPVACCKLAFIFEVNPVFSIWFFLRIYREGCNKNN